LFWRVIKQKEKEMNQYDEIRNQTMLLYAQRQTQIQQAMHERTTIA
jgi:hypothetical protein